MAQIFVAGFGWSEIYPMSHMSEAHEALGIFFAREGIPLKMIVDNSKKMKYDEITKKYKHQSTSLHGLTL